MTDDQETQYVFKDNICQLSLTLSTESKNVENIRNCDIFIEANNFLIYSDVVLLRFKSKRQFDVQNVKSLIIRYNREERTYNVSLPCLPEDTPKKASERVEGRIETRIETAAHVWKTKPVPYERPLDLWKLKRLTDICQLQLNDNTELLKFCANFGYGYARKYHGISVEYDISSASRIAQPHLISPIQRSIDREIEEMRDFSHEQYKINFVQLPVPEGHDDPVLFITDFNEVSLSTEEECVLHNLSSKTENFDEIQTTYVQNEVDCCLISILLAICYDVRSTSNEPTCESGWTRSILSATLSHFESFDNLKDVVISFLRRALIYPIYRCYNFAHMCIEDAIDALLRGPNWILKQFLVTYKLFASSEPGRDALNHYYIENYIRYLNSTHCNDSHLEMLSRNLKNVVYDIGKKDLRLDLAAIEADLLREIMTDSPNTSTTEDETEQDDDDEEEEEYITSNDDDDYNGTESGEDENESSSSETEENSVIEQQMDALKI